MKTILVSDLEGTLMKNNQTLSSYTIETIENLDCEKLVLFGEGVAAFLVQYEDTERKSFGGCLSC